MQNLLDEFEAIASEPFLRTFLQKHGFRIADSRSHPDQFVLATFLGQIDSRSARITHRLLDEKSSSAEGSHINHLTLELDGNPVTEVRFCGNY